MVEDEKKVKGQVPGRQSPGSTLSEYCGTVAAAQIKADSRGRESITGPWPVTVEDLRAFVKRVDVARRRLDMLILIEAHRVPESLILDDLRHIRGLLLPRLG